MTDSDRTDWPTALAEARRERDQAREACRVGAEALCEARFQLHRLLRRAYPAPDMGGPRPSEIPARRALKEADAALEILRGQATDTDTRKDPTDDR